MAETINAKSDSSTPLQRSLFDPDDARRADRTSLPPFMLERVRELIAQNLSYSLPVAALARTAGLSVSHFSRCFRNSTGMPPHVYILRQRLLKAEHLLLATEIEIAQIAFAAGFADQAHFTHRFHISTGMTPRVFRTRRKIEVAISSRE